MDADTILLALILAVLASIRELLAGHVSKFDDLSWRGRLYRWVKSLRDKRVI